MLDITSLIERNARAPKVVLTQNPASTTFAKVNVIDIGNGYFNFLVTTSGRRDIHGFDDVDEMLEFVYHRTGMRMANNGVLPLVTLRLAQQQAIDNQLEQLVVMV